MPTMLIDVAQLLPATGGALRDVSVTVESQSESQASNVLRKRRNELGSARSIWGELRLCEGIAVESGPAQVGTWKVAETDHRLPVSWVEDEQAISQDPSDRDEVTT